MMETLTPYTPVFDTEGVLGRRVAAWLVDALVLLMVMSSLYLVVVVLGLLTFGLGWLLFALTPVVPFAYCFLFLASRHAATPGQILLGLRLAEHTTGRRPTPFEALVWTALYVVFITLCAPLLLLAVVLPRHRAPHDVLAGLIMVRGQPLTAPPGAWNMAR